MNLTSLTIFLSQFQLIMDKALKREFDSLRTAIEKILNVELVTKSNYRKNVNARMIFSKILLDKGHTSVSIGRYLQRSHCTVIYYRGRFDGYIMTDSVLKEQYEHAKAAHYGNFDPVYDMNKSQLKREIFDLRSQLSKKDEEMHSLKKKYSWRSDFNGIQEMLYQKVPRGREQDVERAINTYLNGLHYR